MCHSISPFPPSVYVVKCLNSYRTKGRTQALRAVVSVLSKVSIQGFQQQLQRPAACRAPLARWSTQCCKLYLPLSSGLLCGPRQVAVESSLACHPWPASGRASLPSVQACGTPLAPALCYWVQLITSEIILPWKTVAFFFFFFF